MRAARRPLPPSGRPAASAHARRRAPQLRRARRSARVAHAAPQSGQMPPAGAVWLAGGGSWEEASWAEAAGLPGSRRMA